MISSDEIYEAFYTALKKYADEYGRGFKAFLGADKCVSAAYAGMLLDRSRTASLEKQKAIAKACGYEYKAFLEYGSEELNNETEQKQNKVVSVQDKIIKEHHELIERFQDREAGREVNQYLVELEELDTVEFYGAIGNLKGLVRKLRKKRKVSLVETDNKKTGTEGE